MTGLVPAQVLYVGVAQEKQRVFRTVRRRNPATGATYPWLVPGTQRYLPTPAGIRQAVFLTRLTQRLLITGLAELGQPDPPVPSRLRAAVLA
jgi:hypothetical protein